MTNNYALSLSPAADKYHGAVQKIRDQKNQALPCYIFMAHCYTSRILNLFMQSCFMLCAYVIICSNKTCIRHGIYECMCTYTIHDAIL